MDEAFSLIADLLKQIPGLDPMPTIVPAVVPGPQHDIPILGL